MRRSFRASLLFLTTLALALSGLSWGLTGATGSTASSAAAMETSTAGGFVPVTPTRILDTRLGNGAPVAAIRPGATLHLQVTGRGRVPTTGVSSVVLNVTAVRPAATGHLTLHPDGTTRPNASSLSFLQGDTSANLVIAQVGSNGKVAIHNNSTGTIHLLADVTGYHLAATSTTPTPTPTPTTPSPTPTTPTPTPTTPTPTPTPTTPTPTPTPPPASACTTPAWTSSQPFGTWQTNGYLVNNNMWSGEAGPQTISACSSRQWSVTSNQPGTGTDDSVKTYPDTQRHVSYPLSSLKSMPSTFDVTVPPGGGTVPAKGKQWNAAYDLWLDNFGTEVMVWNTWTMNWQYWYNTYRGQKVTIDGVTYFAYRNSSSSAMWFIRENVTNKGSVDLAHILQWAVANGWLKSSQVLGEVEYGFEVSYTGEPTKFTLNDYTLTLP